MMNIGSPINLGGTPSGTVPVQKIGGGGVIYDPTPPLPNHGWEPERYAVTRAPIIVPPNGENPAPVNNTPAPVDSNGNPIDPSTPPNDQKGNYVLPIAANPAYENVLSTERISNTDTWIQAAPQQTPNATNYAPPVDLSAAQQAQTAASDSAIAALEAAAGSGAANEQLGPQQTYVNAGDVSSGSGSGNSAALIIVLIVAAGVGVYLYIRHRKGDHAAAE